MSDNTKERLFEMMSKVGGMPINEIKNHNIYLSMLNEGVDNKFIKLSYLFQEHNKLTGNLDEDKKYLNEYLSLCENNDFDPFSHLEKTNKINEKNDCLLSISSRNAKLDHPYLSLPAGYTCPFADKCKTCVPRNRERDPKTGTLVQDCGDIRCYAASEEARYPSAQKMRWRNYDLLQKFDTAGQVNLILKSLEYFEQSNYKIDVFRIHESGDFYNQEYFNSWIEVAKQKPEILFYAYTKSLPFWIEKQTDIPENLKLIASVGGKHDDSISKHDLRSAVIVNSPEEAKSLQLPIDIDDTLAYNGDSNFALLIHGAQPKGSEASKHSINNRKIVRDVKNKLNK